MKRRYDQDRLLRSRIFYLILGIIGLSALIYLLLALQSLVLPTIIGMLIAYICAPLVRLLRQKRVPHGLSALLVFIGIIGLIVTVGRGVVSSLPSDEQLLELRVSARYTINTAYLWVTGKESFDQEEGNIINELVGDELEPLINTINSALILTDSEKEQFLAYSQEKAREAKKPTQSYTYFALLQQMPITVESLAQSKEHDQVAKPEGAIIVVPQTTSKIGLFLSAVSNWIILPFVVIFFLLDDGEVRRFFIGLVPNPYFEMALTIFDNVDRAIGNYLRGTLMQSSLVASCFVIGLLSIGYSFQAAVLIGITAGLANAIPFLGPALGLFISIIYAMVTPDIMPHLFFLGNEHVIPLVVILVVMVQALDNAVFQPLVLGKAVNLHPLVVVLGATGGSILFGFIGLLFAIPSIVIFNEIITTVFKQSKAYYIIY